MEEKLEIENASDIKIEAVHMGMKRQAKDRPILVKFRKCRKIKGARENIRWR